MAATTAVTVVGSGPVALAYALFAARHRPVLLDAWRPPHRRAGAVESVPAAVLTLLLELGVVPPELDVAELHRTRRVAWEAPEAAERPGRAAAHLDRSALAAALWRRVEACPTIRLIGRDERERAHPPVAVDARGRGSAAGGRRLQPQPAWLATTCTVARGGADGRLRLAAAPDGYVYRLGSARWLTVGWVSPARPVRTAGELVARVADAGAGWVLDDVSLEGSLTTRVASLSLAAPGDRPPRIRLGDAALARDALASQGLSLGLSDARLAARPDWTATATAERTDDALGRHVRELSGVLATCRHRHEPAWRRYAEWVASIRAEGILR